MDEHVTSMTAEAQMLRYEVREQRKRMSYLAFMVTAVIAFGAVLMIVAVINRSTLAKIDQTQEYLIECTTPGPTTPTPADPRTGHPCFDAAQRRTGEAVEKIIEGVRGD